MNRMDKSKRKKSNEMVGDEILSQFNSDKPDLTKVHNEMIALWMGVKNVWVHPKFGVYEAEDETGYIDWVDVGIKSLDYHRDWNKLMPALKKWDDLPLDDFDLDSMQEYINLCDEIDHLVSCYEIIPVYTHFVKCIKWYSNQPQKAS